MKYIITERQHKLLKEISIVSGVYDVNVIKIFFNVIIERLTKKKMAKIARDYFESVVGQDMSKFDDDKISSYLYELSFYNPNLKSFPINFRNNDVISNLAYYISEKFFKIERSNFNLEYIKIKDGDYVIYFFFDNELEELIGSIECNKMDEPYAPKGSYQVLSSSVDKTIKGMGYGKNMYLTVINDVKILFSDKTLYRESLNIWVNVLPKYINTVGYVDNANEFHTITNKTKIPFDNVKRFYALK